MSNISPEVQRFPINKGVERATIAGPEIKAVRGPAGPQGPQGPPGPAGETKVVYVERRSAQVADVQKSFYAVEDKANNSAVSINTIEFGNQVFSAYDFTIDETIPEDGSSSNKMEMYNNNDILGVRLVQVYERVCADACPSKCPTDCIQNLPGLLVGTFAPTTFTGATLNSIVGALPLSAYHTGIYPYTGLGNYRNSFANLEVASVSFAAASYIPANATAGTIAADLGTILQSSQITPAIITGIATGQATTNTGALGTAIAAALVPVPIAAAATPIPVVTAGAVTALNVTAVPIEGNFYTLVYCDGAARCASESVIDVFSWYLAKVTGVYATTTTVSVGPPAVFAWANIVALQVTPLSPACEYPSDTKWASLRSKGTCVSLPTKVLAVQTSGTVTTTSIYDEPTNSTEKVPVYMAVPPFTWRKSENRSDYYSVAVPVSQTTGLTDKTGAVPQGTASHPVGIQYCVRKQCCPSAFGIRAGQFCGGCRVDSRIWGFRVMYFDSSATDSITNPHNFQELNWSKMLPFSSLEGFDGYNDVSFGAWALTTEASSSNSYAIADSVLQMAVEKIETYTTNQTGSKKISLTTVCSDKFRIDFLLNPDPEGSGNVAPPLSFQTASAEGVTSPAVFVNSQTSPLPALGGYQYSRLNVNCSKKFSVTDLKLIGAEDTCPQDALVNVQLRVHNNSEDVSDLPEDSREIGISCPYSNVTNIYTAVRSGVSEPRVYHAVILSNAQHVTLRGLDGRPLLDNAGVARRLAIDDTFYKKFLNEDNLIAVFEGKDYALSQSLGILNEEADALRALKVNGVLLSYNYAFTQSGTISRNGTFLNAVDVSND